MPNNKLFTDLYKDRTIHNFARVKMALEELSEKYGINDTDGLYDLILNDERSYGGIPKKIYRIPNVGSVTWAGICRLLMELGYGDIIFNKRTEQPIEQNEECKYIAVKDFVLFPSMFGHAPFYTRSSCIKRITIIEDKLSDSLIQGYEDGQFFVTEKNAKFVMEQI